MGKNNQKARRVALITGANKGIGFEIICGLTSIRNHADQFLWSDAALPDLYTLDEKKLIPW